MFDVSSADVTDARDVAMPVLHFLKMYDVSFLWMPVAPFDVLDTCDLAMLSISRCNRCIGWIDPYYIVDVCDVVLRLLMHSCGHSG